MLYEIIGYIASAFIVVSLMMNSIIKLRTFGLIGAVLFSIYGFVIGAIPVGILNLLNAVIHSFFLYQSYTRKDFFRILEVRPENMYLLYFINFNKKKIKKFFPDFNFELPNDKYFTFFVLRNLNVAGVVVGLKQQNELEIVLDFVIPEYRDFKIGDYVYHHSKSFFTERNIFKIRCKSSNTNHVKYMRKMGFKLDERNGNENFYTYLM